MSLHPFVKVFSRNSRRLTVLIIVLLFVCVAYHVIFPSKSKFKEANPVLTLTEMQYYLNSLEIVERPLRDYSYRRKYFGTSWEDIDNNGCSQRRDVLYRDLIKERNFVIREDKTCNHIVVSGSWYDPYTGYLITLNNLRSQEQSQQIQIDHVVPLSLAWRYGAAFWSNEKKVAFANDLDNLVAVSGSANQQKSDSGPEEWQPVVNKCWYASVYIKVKAKYQLAISRSEKIALLELMSWCK